eukprot:jgi/Hompol1/79/HPOL_004123-RA
MSIKKLLALNPVTVFTDGSCLFSGSARYQAGYGIYYGEGDKRNVSARLRVGHPDNNRAELMAVVVALQKTPSALVVHTDSEFVMEGIQAIQLNNLEIRSTNMFNLYVIVS